MNPQRKREFTVPTPAQYMYIAGSRKVAQEENQPK